MKRSLRSKGNLARLGVTLAAMLLLGAVFVGPVHADDEGADRSFVVADRCEGFGGLQSVPADAAAVRSVGKIPPEFKLRGEATGKATLTVAAFICDPVFIDGDDAGRFLYSNVSVSLAAPHSGTYDIWQFTDLPAFHTRLRQIGIFSPLLKDMSVGIETTAGAPVAGSASVPWTPSPYTIEAAIDPAPAPLLAGVNACSSPPQPSAEGCAPSDHWFKGPQGTVYSAHANCDFSAAPAAITIRAAEGSPLAEMLGADEVTVAGVWARFEATALWDFEEAFKEGRAERPECEAVP